MYHVNCGEDSIAKQLTEVDRKPAAWCPSVCERASRL